jgi:DNA repair exonuclease SbcCD nuclease subunit
MHTSDLHLGDESLPCNRRERFDLCVCPILVVKQAMEQWRADVVLMAGDVFDNARVSDGLLTRAAKLFHELPAPVVIGPGNHDALVSGNVYERMGRFDGGVHVVCNPEGELLSFLDGALTVWARPTIEHAPWYHPLAGAPARPTRGHYVTMAHGEFVGPSGREAVIHNGSPITTEDILATNADYVALGHRDRTECVSDAPVPVWYSGAPLRSRGAGTLGVTLADGVVVERVAVNVTHECAA